MCFLEKFYFSFKTIDKKDLIRASLIGVVIPNIMLFIICSWYGISRAAINIDYLIVIVLMRALQFRFSWLISLALLFVAFFVDILLIALQLFPFIKLGDVFYLSTFIFIGPIVYRYYLEIFILLFLIEYILIAKTMIKVKLQSFLTITVLFCLLVLLDASQRVIKPDTQERFIGSRALFLIKNYDNSFFTLNNLKLLEPTKYKAATEPWFANVENGVLSNKLLLVIAESWGESRDSKIEESLFKVLKSNKNQFKFFKQGSSTVLGATVTGEMREICKLEPQTLSNIDNINDGFENCLPNKLKKQGYETVALYGGNNLMYGMRHWYPLSGFSDIYFGDDIDMVKDITGGAAIYEGNLISIIANTFKQNDRLFYYWLTSSTHAPYPEKDIRNHRFSCKAFNIDRNTESCRNLMLHAQFFDSLAELVAKPEMKGVEVIVVGDHSPPILNFTEGLRTFYTSKVAWIHFKVKDEETPKETIDD